MVRTFLASLHELSRMLAFIEEHIVAFGFKELQSAKILLASEEALVNIITYGYSTKTGTIEIECRQHNPAGIELVIRDNGILYNPLTSPAIAEFDPKAPIEKRRIGGIGILIILRVMDEVTYRCENNHNVLTLVKYLSSTSQNF